MRIGSTVIGIVVVGVALGQARHVRAQEPDIRGIRPVVMLLTDTSGSMERLPSCVCSTASCDECLPMCGDASVSQRNRWATAVEALTGSWSTYTCSKEDRRDPAYAAQFDYRYFLPHHRLPLSTPQNADGVLDVYAERVKFGLMTFDGAGTLIGGEPLVPATTFRSAAFLAQSTTEPGMWSYGDPKPFTFPGCATTYMVDNGARNASAPIGGLVSVGAEAADYRVVNQRVQDTLRAVRPYGSTPIAGMLDDVRYYFDNNTDVADARRVAGGDPYYQCRSRYVLLLTDGYPDADFRDARFNCAAQGYACPYQTPEEIAADLCRFDSGANKCTGRVSGLFVVGFDVADPATTDRLNDIADLGGTREALFANDRNSLMARIAQALNQAAPDVTTRTAPAFASSASASSNQQYQFNTGFRVPANVAEPWNGVLERRQFTCNASLVPEEQPITDADRFHLLLDQRVTARRLLTVIPNNTSDLDDTIVGEAASRSAENFRTDNTRLTRQMLGVPDAARRDYIVQWVHGGTATPRVTNRMGDIYHSTPVIVGPPAQDLPDEAFNLFRIKVASRPTTLYVGTNDGVLHAFVVEKNGSTEAGEELWGFIPPILLPKLDSAVSAHQLMVDGTPVVREVYYSRRPGDVANGDIYHTVLIAGLRGGGKAFVALDVTDPRDPKFLWQFAHQDLGMTYGRPAIGQVLVNWKGTLQERAVAILPGGTGSIDTVRDRGPIGCPGNGKGSPPVTQGTTRARANQKCWSQREGRQTFIVDVETGEVMKNIDHRTFNAPLVGAPSLYLGDTGTVATRAFLTDADGVIWRIDLSSTNPNQWDAEPFHDIFWDGTPSGGQPGYEPPILSTDASGNVVIIQATGDMDRLDDGTVRNKVVSLTELRNANGTLASVPAKLNWEIALNAGEQVTGPLELFDSKVYFGSFQSQSSATDACALGQSRLWGVHYTDADASRNPKPELEYPANSGVMVASEPPIPNTLIMGVGVAQRPRCYAGREETDPYVGGSRYLIQNTGGGQFQLIAQVSRGGDRTSEATVGTLTRTLPTPAAFTRVRSWAGSVE